MVAEYGCSACRRPRIDSSGGAQDIDKKDEELEAELELKNKKQIGGRKLGEYVKEPKAKEVVETGFRIGDDGGSGFGGRGSRGGRGGRGRGDFGGRSDFGGRGDFGGRSEGGFRGGREGGGFGRGGGGDRASPREDRGGERGPPRERSERPAYNDRPSYNGGPRGPPREHRTGAAPAIDDSSAFPTLGGGK